MLINIREGICMDVVRTMNILRIDDSRQRYIDRFFLFAGHKVIREENDWIDRIIVVLSRGVDDRSLE